MFRIAPLALLAGCQLVFTLDDVEPSSIALADNNIYFHTSPGGEGDFVFELAR